MKIDKVLFACSASTEYAPFWNIQARIYKECLGIEPVCLLFKGKKEEMGMSEEHGKIFEMELDPSLPWSLQMVWSKFDYPTREPDTTWLMGDIDLIPLQADHFTTKIASLPDDVHAHLNAGGIAQPRLGQIDGFVQVGPERKARDAGICGGADLPGHYHVAKGRSFELFTQGRPFLQQVKDIVDSDRYGMGVMGAWGHAKRDENPYWYYWCGEENYSSDLIWQAIQAQKIKFAPIYYNNNNGVDRLNRDEFVNGDYTYDQNKAKAKGYVDVHCARPFDKQKDALARLVNLAWGI